MLRDVIREFWYSFRDLIRELWNFDWDEYKRLNVCLNCKTKLGWRSSLYNRFGSPFFCSKACREQCYTRWRAAVGISEETK